MLKKILFCCLIVLLGAPRPLAAANVLKKLFEEGVIAYTNHQYGKAIDLFEKTLTIYPEFAHAYYYLGLSHQEMGTDPKDVLWLFEKTVEIDPTFAEAYNNIGKIQYKLGNYDLAEENCKKALELDPNSVNGNLFIGWIYLLGKSQPLDAIPHFEKVIEQQKIPYAYFGLGMSYYMSRQNFRVLDMITQLRQMNQDYLAKQLERMVQRGEYVATSKEGKPLMTKKNLPTIEIDDDEFYANKHNDAAINNKALGSMKVRLSDEPFPAYEQPTGPGQEKNLTGKERIRQLQRKSKGLVD